MSSITNSGVQLKSCVIMLPIKDLHVTDLTALYSIIFSIIFRNLNVVLPWVTFGQEVYIKAYEIASSMEMNVFLQLGEFHHLMSFFGFIGSLMEGSDMNQCMNQIILPYLKIMKYLLNLFLGLSKDKKSYLITLLHQLYG